MCFDDSVPASQPGGSCNPHTHDTHHGTPTLNEQLLETLRLRLARFDRLPQLALLGIGCGLLTGTVIILFRLAIELVQTGVLSLDDAGRYRDMRPAVRLLLSVTGALLIGLLLQYVARGAQHVGVVHVMERLAYHQGRLPLRNAIWQFAGGALSIISGHSVGREGPSVHLGAASASLLGQTLALPDNSTRTLVACGVAAAIAASFDTPLAGVIFSMEVIMMEYTIAGFTPVILAAVSATSVSRWVFGSQPAFDVPALEAGTLHELPLVLVMGILTGTMAAMFILFLRGLTRHTMPYPLWLRTTLAGLIIGLCAWPVPEIMGIGYDTVNAAMLGELGVGLLLAVALMKLLATAAGIGLGLPGGLIGPTLVIGAATGAALGQAAGQLLSVELSSSAFYAMLGMGAMMGATLQAPLAALTTLVEFTANPAIILPGMLVIISAALTSSEMFGQPSVFLMLLRERGLDYRNDPVSQSLRRLSVARAMNPSVVATPRVRPGREIESLLEGQPEWIAITEEGRPTNILPAADLARYLKESPEYDPAGPVDLMEIPALRRDVATTDLRANLQEAMATMSEHEVEALCVMRRGAGHRHRIYGILTSQEVGQHYTYGT